MRSLCCDSSGRLVSRHWSPSSRAAAYRSLFAGPCAAGSWPAPSAMGFDPPFEALTAVWLPWKGKTFEPDAEQGRNLFSPGTRRLMRVTLPKYRTTTDRSGACCAFRFITSTGPSAFSPGVDVLRIDYRDVPENPSWPIRRILDELVMIEDGLYLGQALMEFRGTLRRAAWFSLEWQPIPAVAQAS